ncbi:hypothetical protein D8B26_006871 [Coccidioides posadasii str. Silveira]|uniref:uncharacterized protein n=1 Tax=Coccidioides posadasii (strain RMSCC 757 / Silveira) TaxID=443226 RepID=UPI001BF06885|nr:hypothetical protein D8B26_006871 [Coccidioides posadasii str. Silveira]
MFAAPPRRVPAKDSRAADYSLVPPNGVPRIHQCRIFGTARRHVEHSLEGNHKYGVCMPRNRDAYPDRHLFLHTYYIWGIACIALHVKTRPFLVWSICIHGIFGTYIMRLELHLLVRATNQVA